MIVLLAAVMVVSPGVRAKLAWPLITASPCGPARAGCAIPTIDPASRASSVERRMAIDERLAEAALVLISPPWHDSSLGHIQCHPDSPRRQRIASKQP